MVSGFLIAGLPTFTKQPSDVNVRKNTSFTLTCEAVGPPNPVTIVWLHKGQKISQPSLSPSNKTIQGKCFAPDFCLARLFIEQWVLTLVLSVCFFH